ncbi:MAG: hypothetical protein HY774_19565 [Acidobacteria bacterium]|nr:hypothetical protein [Acidobacteriota bacterium]
MSYDIEFFRFDPDKETIQDVIERRNEAILQLRDIDSLPRPSAKEDKLRQALVQDLLQLHPSLQMEPNPRGFRYGCVIESTDFDSSIPDIEIGVGQGLLTFSYSAPASIFQTVSQIIAVFEKHRYFAWDPQTDSRVLPDGVLAQSRDMFEQTRGRVIDFLHDLEEEILTMPSESEEFPKEKKKDQTKSKKKKHKSKKK